MTYEEAIKIFRRQLEIANKNVADFEKTFKNQKSNYRYDVELYELAISALEKQIPKKPIFWNKELYICPNCHRAEYIKQRDALDVYCGFCGQWIDWSDTK